MRALCAASPVCTGTTKCCWALPWRTFFSRCVLVIEVLATFEEDDKPTEL